MERSFIAAKESKYVQDINRQIELGNQQREFIKKFFIEKGIEANLYIVSGDGSINQPFDEDDKKEIGLRIEPTNNDLIKFNKMLCKPSKHNLCAFKKSSTIAKEFSQRCVDEQIIINLHSPRISSYFKSLGYHGLTRSQFPVADEFYIKIESEYLTKEDTPEGFTEIKLSEYYIAEEKREW